MVRNQNHHHQEVVVPVQAVATLVLIVTDQGNTGKTHTFSMYSNFSCLFKEKA